MPAASAALTGGNLRLAVKAIHFQAAIMAKQQNEKH
jgi:hypothetical protein